MFVQKHNSANKKPRAINIILTANIPFQVTSTKVKRKERICAFLLEVAIGAYSANHLRDNQYSSSPIESHGNEILPLII